MRILFVMLHPGFIRYYDGALRALASGGHDVQLAFEVTRDKLGESELARRLAESSSRMTCSVTPPRTESVRDFLARSDRSATRSGDGRAHVDRRQRREERWDSLATTVRLMLDYVRFFEPAFAGAVRLRDRAEKRVPRVYVPLLRALATVGSTARAAVGACLRGVEQLVPTSPALERFVRDARPDLVLVTPLIELGSQQVDYVKAARRAGVRSAHCVASWDNLTSKGLIRVAPDHVVVWNEAQKREAVELHGVAPEAVVVTGAQVFDEWFVAEPSRSREDFCRDVGLDPARPFALYVGSSSFIAPEEVPFVDRWITSLRRSDAPTTASAGVLVRPHPANARQWRVFEPSTWTNVAVWPPIGHDVNAIQARRDYVDSLHHCAAVVGINTSAQLEAGIVGRPVFTVRSPEFAHAQEGTLHFQHLVDSEAGVVQVASTLDEHLAQLGQALAGRLPMAERRERFVRAFIRPFGESTPAVPMFVNAIESLARMGAPPPRGDAWWVPVARPLGYMAACLARLLAEDRPLWVYPLRPFVTAVVWTTAGAHRARTVAREGGRLGLKRLRRALRRTQYEAPRAMGRAWKRAQKQVRRVFAAAHGAQRRG